MPPRPRPPGTGERCYRWIVDPELAAKPLSDVDSTLRLQFICGLCDTKAEVAVAKAFKWTLEEMRVLVTGGGFPANFATAAARAKHGRKAGVSHVDGACCGGRGADAVQAPRAMGCRTESVGKF